MKQGKLYGVSVGPGDPELMTLKAVNRIRRCGVLAAPRTAEGNSLALQIAAGAVDLAEKQIEYLDLPMTRDRDKLAKNYDAVAERIAVYLEAGRDVAVLSLGDASLFSSYSYLCRILLKRGYDVETIPGVTSFCACAALLNRSLTAMDTPLHILPASLPDLPSALALPGGKVLMKSGGALPEVKRLLHTQGLTERAALVTDCGLPTQHVFLNINEATEESYFTTILIAP
ncbi:MAG: precorrin-2 C(20)-methyltransferase [Clostridia bacterium]|jgi:precorrin-2 C(20)-methyltransferase|nr:precorrin-2 C(20)-methyltransferase [Clostridia bacterium]